VILVTDSVERLGKPSSGIHELRTTEDVKKIKLKILIRFLIWKKLESLSKTQTIKFTLFNEKVKILEFVL